MKSQLGVQTRSLGVVVTRGEVHVAAQHVALAAHHHEHFGVGLVADDPVDHMRAGALQTLGERNVRRFIEPGSKLNDDRDLFASHPRVVEQIFERRLRPRSVQGLFDGENVWITRRLPHKVQHHRKTLKRMMNQHIAFGDAAKEVAVLAGALRDSPAQRAEILDRAWRVGREPQ